MSRSAFEWQFGGWLAGLPAAWAWSILAAAAVLGIALVFWSYRHPLRALSPGARRWLTALRAALVLAVLVCLANPTRVATVAQDSSGRPRLEVVVDRSDSMNVRDARGDSRLADAAHIWRRHAGEADERFGGAEYHRFGTRLSDAESLNDALNGAPPGSETHLYEALDAVVAKAPPAVVCLTDGLDTTDVGADRLAADARQRGVPLYFVVGSNHLQPVGMMSIRDIRVPSKVLRQTRFVARAVLEIATAQPRSVPVELWSGDRRLAAETLPVRAGLNTFPWSVPVDAGEPGPLPLEFRLGEGATQQLAASTTQVVEKTSADILYYQGALQWGYRFLLSALRTDPSFRLTSILNPALGLKMPTSMGDLAELPDLPDNAADLEKYQIVVLAHVFADQLSDRQQRALLEYARGGGGVLFIAPDSNATLSFAGTALEQMLPVSFETASPESPAESAARRFLERMRDSEGALSEGSSPGDLPRLTPFALPAGAGRSKVTELFSAKDPASLPRFSEYARVRAAKPGAEVLAVHPTDREADGRTPRVLLARQRFGEGFTAALTTDLLWRWKMSLPHESRAVEKFWQQLLLSLTPPVGEGLRIVKSAEGGATGRPLAFRIEGGQGEAAPQVTVVSPSGATRPVSMSAGESESAWAGTFTPETAGRWEVRASDLSGGQARMTVVVAAREQTRETANLPSDREGLRRLAESTGGALIEDDPVFSAPDAAPAPDRKTTRPLWDESGFLALLIGLYGTELISRRWLKLL